MKKSHSKIVIVGSICVGLFLCGLSVCLGVIGAGPSIPAWTDQTARQLNMEVYYAKGPIAILVHHGRDPNSGYVVVDHDRRFTLVASRSELLGLENEQDVLLAFAEDCAVDCVFQPLSDRPLKEISLIEKQFGLVDLDVDGQPDLRCWYATKRTEAWYDGKWTELAAEVGSRYSRKLQQTGAFIEFDFKRHKWLRKKK